MNTTHEITQEIKDSLSRPELTRLNFLLYLEGAMPHEKHLATHFQIAKLAKKEAKNTLTTFISMLYKSGIIGIIGEKISKIARHYWVGGPVTMQMLRNLLNDEREYRKRFTQEEKATEVKTPITFEPVIEPERKRLSINLDKDMLEFDIEFKGVNVYVTIQ